MKTWIDGGTKVEVTLPWKNTSSMFGPFYPILNDVLFFYHSNQNAYIVNSGQLSSEFLPEYRYGTESSDVCERASLNFQKATEWEREVFSSERETFCMKRRFYCVDLLTGVQTGPWVSFKVFSVS